MSTEQASLSIVKHADSSILQLLASRDLATPLQLEGLWAFVDAYRWLAQAHVVDFFTQQHWQRIPSEWHILAEPFASSDKVYERCVQLAGDWHQEDTWPASLQQFIHTAQSWSLDRQPGDWPAAPIEQRILYGMNPKKIHEVERLAWLIAQLADKYDSRQVVDLGSGQGYLSRALAYQYNLNVLAVDADDVQTCGAQRFQQQTLRHTSSTAQAATDRQAGKLLHATHHVTEHSLQALWTSIQQDVAPTESPQALDTANWLLCGLHTCGDLASSTLRLFCDGDARMLVNVGCCYNLLSETAETSTGFPLSDRLRAMQHATPMLGVTSRHLACQAPGRWPTLRDATYAAFERNYYRALLHWFMVQRDMAQPEESAPQIGRLGRRPLNTFADYAMVAMRKLADRHVPRHEHITAFLSADQDECRRELNAFEQAHTAARCQVAVFWTLRALLAPALERLLLADRVAYLREHGHAAWLIAPFDPTASPRNLAIISVKQP